MLEAAFTSNDFDGFHLRFRLFPGESYAAHERMTAVSLARRGEVTVQWARNNSQISVNGLAVWSLSLDLVSSANRHRGTLAIHRAYSPRGLQLDINLLTSGFPVALADALDRTMPRAVELVPHAGHEDRGFAAAQAV